MPIFDVILPAPPPAASNEELEAKIKTVTGIRVE